MHTFAVQTAQNFEAVQVTHCPFSILYPSAHFVQVVLLVASLREHSSQAESHFMQEAFDVSVYPT